MAPHRILRFLKPVFVLALLLAVNGRVAAQHGHRYWDANADSLRRALAGQHSDSARLRTLTHLTDLTQEGKEAQMQGRDYKELVALTSRLKRPERRAYHLMLTGLRLADSFDNRAALDSLKASVRAFDALGKPIPGLLVSIRGVYNALNEQEGRRAYYQAKLAYYQKRGALENMAACYHGLGGYYVYRGDYNQAISNYLRAADLYRTFYYFWYVNELQVAGTYYALWGNQPKALQYLRTALAARNPKQSASYLYRSIGSIYLQQHDYPAALQYANLALADVGVDSAAAAINQAYGLVLKSAVLLAQRRVADAGKLLKPAQRLADSIKMPLVSPAGDFELDATWARYYAARGEVARAQAAWLAAYRKALESHSAPRRLAYLRELAAFYRQHGQPGPAATYALAAVALADTVDAAQGVFHVAQYEVERANQAQTARIAHLRQAQIGEAARARRQQRALWALLGGAGLLVLLAGVLYYAFRRSERLHQLVTRQKHDLQTQRDQLNASLTELRTTQAQLIQREKMASLGELTAGIAHEIQNPLNFVTNFAEVSAELLKELAEEQARPARNIGLESELMGDLQHNMVKITQHGQRAASIVRGMLEHSRTSPGERAPTDLNALCQEYLRLAYHGVRAKDNTFNAELTTELAADLPLVEAVGADLSRVLLNLFANAFYAVQQRQRTGDPGYRPTVGVRTRLTDGHVGIEVHDNGAGIPAAVRQKIFQPFFTTKPSGEGTGLGLSLSHDIIAQGHGGTLTVESHEGEGTTFRLALPTKGRA